MRPGSTGKVGTRAPTTNPTTATGYNRGQAPAATNKTTSTFLLDHCTEYSSRKT